MRLQVTYLSLHLPEISADDYWDHAMLNDLLDATGYEIDRRINEWPGPWDPLVVVIPARHHASEQDVETIQAHLTGRHGPTLVVLTGDEEHRFPATRLHLEPWQIWVQTPTNIGALSYRPLPNGYSPHGRRKPNDLYGRRRWMFAGQVNNPERVEAVDVLRQLSSGYLVTTDGFAQGLAPDAYIAQLRQSRFVICPPGSHTPDTFRVYEALEANAVPIVKRDRYWHYQGMEDCVAQIDQWSQVADIVDMPEARWLSMTARTQAAYALLKRAIVEQLVTDLNITPEIVASDDPTDLFEVIISTSSIPSHPSTEIIEETIASVRARLPKATIWIACDGIRSEQATRRDVYDEYLARLTHWASTQHAIYPVIMERHLHQANSARNVVWRMNQDKALLFVEHDTPLVNEIPFLGLWDALQSDQVDVIRLAHESRILDEHEGLMLGDVQTVEGVPLRRTAQWSQRPHVAKVSTYSNILSRYVGMDARTMIEDTLYGITTTNPTAIRIAIYHPDGNIQRSTHLDGRSDDPMWPNVFAYDGEIPEGAPYPTALRVD